MQQQASAWLRAAGKKFRANRAHFYRLIIFTLVAPIFVTVVPAAPKANAAVSTTTAPQEVVATASGTTLTVSWGAPAYGANAVTAYQVDYMDSATGTWNTASNSVEPGTYIYAITGLTSGNSYFVRVAAKMGSSLSPWAYPWTKLYGTTTPYRTNAQGSTTLSASGSINYEPGFGLASFGNQAANSYSSATFSRVRYKMQYFSNSGTTYNYVSTDFTKWTETSGNKFGNGTTYKTPAASISTLAIPDATNVQLPIQATASDLTIESSNSSLNANSVNGRLEIWANNYAATNGWSGGSDGSNTAFDYNDAPDATTTLGFGTFQVHNITNAKTILAWNQHKSSTPDIGIGNSPTGCNAALPTDWTYCGSYSSSVDSYYSATNRSNWKLEIFINIPTLMTSSGLIARFDAKNSSSYSSGANWNDISGNSSTAALKNSLTSATVSNGLFNIKAMSFNGLNQYATINSTFNLSYADGISIGFYANFGNASNYERIIDIGAGEANNNILIAREGTTNHMIAEIYNGTTSIGSWCEAANAIVNNSWAHWTIVFSGATCAFYKDGTPYTGGAIKNYKTGATSTTGSVAYVGLPPAGTSRANAYIGRSNWVNDAYFEGQIADLAIYNKTLTLNEIINLKEDQIASTVKAADGTCGTRVNNPNNVTVTTIGNDCVISFAALNNTTTANKWIVPSNVSAARVLVVAGGGGGGSHVGGGGGAGGMIDSSTAFAPSGIISISTGAGGVGSNQLLNVSPTAPGSGANSFFGNSLIALGGGNGAVWTSYANSSGGSGGGGTASGGSWPTGAVSLNSSQGNSGGSSSCNYVYGYPTGGGGGAGAPGENGSCLTNAVGKSGNGGIGKQSNITGTSIYYAGGGGGGGHNQGSYPIFKGIGGLGGGGNGAAWLNGTATTGCSSTSVSADNGVDGLGGGGGGVGTPWSGSCNSYGGRGGSGIVIVRYGTTTLSISENNGNGFTGTTTFTGSTYSYITLPAQNGMNRSGFIFTGWNTAPNGSGTTYVPGSVYQLLGTQTLYAQWTSTITYLANGSTDSRTINSSTAVGGESSTTLSTGISSNASVVTSGLQLNLDATQSTSYSGTGTTWYDISGNGRNATASPTAPTYDSTNKAFLFNGTNNFFDLGSANFQFTGTQNYTLAVMIKEKNLYKNGGEACFICRWYDNSAGSYLLRTSAGVLETYRSGDASFNSGKYLPDPYGWNYIAAAYNGTSIKLYINGELFSSWDTAKGMNASSSIKVYLGASPDGSARYFSGYMSAAQIYNVALSSEQLYQNYLALVPDKKTEKSGSTLTGWSTSQDSSTAVISGSYANGLTALPAPYLRIEATNFNASTKVWTPTNGSSELFVYKGSPSVVSSPNGFGNSKPITAVSGSTLDGIRLNNSTLASFTFCGLARYKYNGTTTYNTERLFNSVDGTAFFGWHGSKVNRFYIDGTWVSYPKPDNVNRDQDWHYVCQTGSNTYWDGVLNSTVTTSSQYFAAANDISLPNMSINYGPSEFSDWEVAEVIIYDQNLSKAQIDYISRYFRNTYGITAGSNVAPNSVMIPATTFASPGSSTLYARWGSTITYDANTASSGTVPATQVFANGTGTLASNSGNLASLGKVFTGWNTAANGTGTFYPAGSTYTGGNVLLFAMFTTPVKISNTTVASDPINLNPYMRFKASDYNTSTKTWIDSSGNGRNTSFVRGTPSLVTTTINSNGSTKSFTTLQGGLTDGIQFKNPQLENWTMFALARYNGTNKGRIFVQENNNFIFGTYNGYSGLAHYDSWVTSEADNFGNSAGNSAGSNWVISTGQRKLYRANGNDLTKASPGGDVPFYSNLAINSTFSCCTSTYTQNSDWQVSEVILFDRALTLAEMKLVEDYIASTYGISAYTKQTQQFDSITVTTALGTSAISDTVTATQGFRNTLTVSPTIPGITFNTSGGTASLTMASTLTVGTYNETITATDFNGNTATIPIQLNVVNPLKWSESNTAGILTTAGKNSKTRLEISGGYGTRVASLTHMTTPAPRGITIDTSTIASGYISLLVDTSTSIGTYTESITVTDGTRAIRTLILTIKVNAPPDISYTSATDAEYPLITSNLFLNYDFANTSSYSGSGTSIADLKGNASYGSVSSASTFSTTAGGSFSLNGTNSLTVGFTPLANTQSYSKFLWFYPTTATGAIIRGCDATGCGGYHETEFELSSNVLYARAYSTGNLNSGSKTVSLNQWHYIGLTWEYVNSSTMYVKLYLDGQVVSSATHTSGRATQTGTAYDVFSQGDTTYMVVNNINGTFLLGAYHIYKAALTPQQVFQNYSNTKTRFLSLSVASPTYSGNFSTSMTEGKSVTYSVFTETLGTGANSFSLSGSNPKFSLNSISPTEASITVDAAITPTSSTAAKTYYETLTATDSTTAATAYYLTITVNPKITITATTDTVTTTFGKAAYDTLTTTANTGTGTITFTRTSSSGSSAITHTTTSGSPAQAVMSIGANLPAGTYYETFTATDSVGATSIKVIKIVVNPALSLVALDGTTLTTTISKATSRRIFVYNGSDTRTATFSVTSKDAHSGITLDQSNLQVLSGGYLTVNVGTTVPANTYTYLVTVRDVTGSATSISISIVVNKWPTIQNVSSVSDNIRLSYDASVGGSVTNSQWNDLSGNSKNMTLTTGAIVTGESTGLMSFNESTTTTSNGSISHLGSTIDTYSVETWIRISGRPTTEACIFCESSGSNSSKNFYFYIRSSGSIGGNYYNGGWGAQTAEYSTALNTWYHVVFTVFKVGSNYYQDLYINGAKYGSTSAASTVAPATANQAYIVAKSAFAADYAKFSMPLLRVYGRSLTATEVQQNYLANLDRFASASSGTTNLVTTAGAATKSQSFTALNGTGTKTFTRSTSTSGISISSTSDNTFALNIDSSLTSVDSRTARTIYETITATDSTSATSSLAFSITINPPIIETATTTTITTTSGIESSTVIFASQGTGNLSITRASIANPGLSLTQTQGTNQATLKVLATANPGTYWETITASDTTGASTNLAIRIVVNPGPTVIGRSTITTTTSTNFKSLGYFVANGTGSLRLTMTPVISGITLDTSTVGVAYINVANSITSPGTFFETLTVTDINGATGILPVTIRVVAPVALTGNTTVTSTYGDSNIFSYTVSGGSAPFNIMTTGSSSMCITSKSTTGGNTVEQFLGARAGTSCTWVVPNGVTSLTGLVVAGGGQGGSGRGGGGGAGSLQTGTMTVAPGDLLTISVGVGGSNASCNSANTPAGCDGTDSIIGISGNTTYLVSKGGGGGGGHVSNYNGRAGGSGGGAGMNYATVAPTGGQTVSNTVPTGWTAYANAGAATSDVETSPNNFRNTGGGGGAGSTGFPGVCNNQTPACDNNGTGGGARPDGGNGFASSITGTSTTYAGGGGGAVGISTSEINGIYKSAIAGNDYSTYLTDKGRAGKGGSPTNPVGTDAAPNSGSGGGGSVTNPGGSGGSGLIVFSYLTPTAAQSNNRISFSLIDANSGRFNMTVPESLTVGTYTQTVYIGSANDAATVSTTATLSVIVIQDTPTATVSLPGSVSIATYGTPVTISAVSNTNGTFNFKKAGSTISGCGSVATSNGLATCTWTPSVVETTTITALLTPTDSVNYRTSIENNSALTVVVGRADTLTVTAANLTATYSESSGSATTTIPARSFTLTGIASIDSITAMSYDFAGTINGGASYATSANAPTLAGTYTITPKSPVFSPGASTNYSKVDFIAGTLTINRASRGAWSATYGSGTNTITYGASKSETPTLTFPGDGARLFSTTSTTCSVNSSTGVLTTLGVGACDIQVVLAQTNNWLSDTKTVTVTINRGLRTATLTPASVTIKYGDTTSVTSTISPALDSAAVNYSSGSSLGCQIDNVTGVVTGTKAAASCSIRVTYDRTDLYESATATASITVNKATSPVVTTDSITALSYTGNTAIVTPTYKVTGILARDISTIIPTADVSSSAAIASIEASTYTSVTSYRYIETSPTTSYDSTTAPSLGGTYAVNAQLLSLLGGLDIANYETPTYVSANLVINPIAQATLKIAISIQESITVPYDVVVEGGSSTGAVSLQVVSGGTASGCAISGLRLTTLTAGSCFLVAKRASDRNYLEVLSETATVSVLNFVQNIVDIFNGANGITINHDVPLTKPSAPCLTDCVPTITSVYDVNSGSATTIYVGLPIHIVGTNLNTVTEVFFQRRLSVDASQITIIDDQNIRVSVPTLNTARAVEIYVVASGGESVAYTGFTTITP